jgi:hypothetical protein
VQTPADAALVDVSRKRAAAPGHVLPAAPAFVRDRHRAAILRQIGHPEHLSDARRTLENLGLQGGDENQAGRCRNGSAAIQRAGRGHANGIELFKRPEWNPLCDVACAGVEAMSSPTGAWPMSLTPDFLAVSAFSAAARL